MQDRLRLCILGESMAVSGLVSIMTTSPLSERMGDERPTLPPPPPLKVESSSSDRLRLRSILDSGVVLSRDYEQRDCQYSRCVTSKKVRVVR